MQSAGGSARTKASALTASTITSRTRAGGWRKWTRTLIHCRWAVVGRLKLTMVARVIAELGIIIRSPFLLTMVVARHRTSRIFPEIAIVEADPVADLEVALELEGQPGHDVSQRLL